MPLEIDVCGRVQHEFKAIGHDGRMYAGFGRLLMGSALPCLLALLAGPLVAGMAPASSVASAASSATVRAALVAKKTPEFLSLEQAVAQVQAQTHGKVLRAGQRQFGDMIEYRIKVLTPDGHVRVVPVRTRKPPGSKKSSKEIH